MESRSFQITWPFRLVNRWLDRIGAARWSGLQLDAARLLEVSQEKTGLSDFGEGHFREGLEVFVDSLIRDADLTPIGRAGLRGMIVTLLCNRSAHRGGSSAGGVAVRGSHPSAGGDYRDAPLGNDLPASPAGRGCDVPDPAHVAAVQARFAGIGGLDST